MRAPSWDPYRLSLVSLQDTIVRMLSSPRSAAQPGRQAATQYRARKRQRLPSGGEAVAPWEGGEAANGAGGDAVAPWEGGEAVAPWEGGEAANGAGEAVSACEGGEAADGAGGEATTAWAGGWPEGCARTLAQNVAVLLAAAAPCSEGAINAFVDEAAKKELAAFTEALQQGLAERGLGIILVALS